MHLSVTSAHVLFQSWGSEPQHLLYPTENSEQIIGYQLLPKGAVWRDGVFSAPFIIHSAPLGKIRVHSFFNVLCVFTSLLPLAAYTTSPLPILPKKGSRKRPWKQSSQGKKKRKKPGLTHHEGRLILVLIELTGLPLKFLFRETLQAKRRVWKNRPPQKAPWLPGMILVGGFNPSEKY